MLIAKLGSGLIPAMAAKRKPLPFKPQGPPGQSRLFLAKASFLASRKGE